MLHLRVLCKFTRNVWIWFDPEENNEPLLLFYVEWGFHSSLLLPLLPPLPPFPYKIHTLRCMFLWGAAVILLYRKGYATDVRRDCLALSLWLLIETHAAGEERLLSPSNRPPPRQKRPSVSPSISVSENTVPKRDGGSPRRAGGEGGKGGGNNDVSSAGGGVDDWAANVASREHYRFVHLALVSTEGFSDVYLVMVAVVSACLDIMISCVYILV